MICTARQHGKDQLCALPAGTPQGAVAAGTGSPGQGRVVGPACVQKASVAQAVEAIARQWWENPLSGLERVKKTFKPLFL